MSAVFAQLKRIIIRSGMSEESIAAKAQCHPLTIKNWLAGKTREPSLELFVRVAAVFGKRLELFGGEVRLMDTPATVAVKATQARQVARMAEWLRQ
jgi:transcriptional regulator with XRE-family HTH domain